MNPVLNGIFKKDHFRFSYNPPAVRGFRKIGKPKRNFIYETFIRGVLILIAKMIIKLILELYSRIPEESIDIIYIIILIIPEYYNNNIILKSSIDIIIIVINNALYFLNFYYHL